MRLRPEAQLKVEPLADFEVIRIAAHGIASPKIPRPRSYSEMSPKSDEDGLLQVREIRDLNLAADLVTLSACDTGAGALEGEEGIANLVRAFLFAGRSPWLRAFGLRATFTRST